MTYGTRLLQFRQKNGLTQTQVAEKLNIAVSTYNSWEADKSLYKIEMLVRLADVFGISPLELIPETTTVTIVHNTSSPTFPPLTVDAHTLYNELISSLKQVSTLKDAEIDRLRQEVRQKDRELAELRNTLTNGVHEPEAAYVLDRFYSSIVLGSGLWRPSKP